MSALEVRSGAFQHQGPIPSRYTCDADDLSPPLDWSAGPKGTVSYALICDDPDAPSGTWTHWVAWNAIANTLPEDVAHEPRTPERMRQGLNSWGKVGYGGPCPPSGTHHYSFRVYALDRALDLPEPTDAKALTAAMKGHVLAQGELIGTYERAKVRPGKKPH
jgi:Raf kinase inhibitor-like YbhB/YbcL family protein